MGAPATSVPARRSGGLRPALVWAHRILGLSTALFLICAGLTGAVLAFYAEIDAALNPAAYRATAEGPPLSPEALAQRIDAGAPNRAVWYMMLDHEPGHAVLAVAAGRVDPKTGEQAELTTDWFNVDPVSGAILAERKWGECCFSRLNLVPFLYEFHHNLSLPGVYGILFMGVVAILWFVDGFIGLALTFPRGRPFFAKWRPAFGIKGGSRFRLNLDLHRAAGLWLFVVLIVVAFTSITMNLRPQVVEPLVSLFSKVTPTPLSGPPLERLRDRTLSYDVVVEAGITEARARGWNDPPSEVFYSPHFGIFGVAFGDHDDPMDIRWLYFDGETAAPKGDFLPGVGTAGDIFLQIQYPIHSGRIFGLTGRIIIAVTGVVVALLAVTGIAVWWMKRAGRRSRAKKASHKIAPTKTSVTSI